jgi:phage terminase small subunit
LSNDLNPKQQRFVDEYLIDLNATQAAIRAGYSEKTARSQGQRLLTHVDVAAAIEAGKAERNERVNVDQDFVINVILETINRCRQADVMRDGNGDPMVVELPDGEVAVAANFNPNAVLKGAELLAKHLSMFVERKDINVTGELAHKHENVSDTDRWLAEITGRGAEGTDKKPRLQ